MPDKEVSAHVLKDENSAIRSPNTALVAAATTSGVPLFADSPFVETVEQTDSGLKRRTTWLLCDTTIEFLPEFKAEEITTAQFVKRFRDPEWRSANPHHPISYMSWMHETLNRLHEKIRGQKPMVMIRRGNRVAFIPQDCEAAKREQILALL